jgi:hypothetical protein
MSASVRQSANKHFADIRRDAPMEPTHSTIHQILHSTGEKIRNDHQVVNFYCSNGLEDTNTLYKFSFFPPLTAVQKDNH